MAIKVGGTEVISNSRELKNIASIDATTVSTLEGVITTDPTLGSLTKSFLSGESTTITLSSTVSPTAVVAVTKEVSQTGASSKGAWDVNATASNYEVYNEAPATSLTVEGWDVSNASYLQAFSVSSEESNPAGLFFKPDGTKMYVVGSTGDDVNEYNLSTAWDISTTSYNQNFSVSSQETGPSGVFFKPDGTKMYVIGFNNDNVNEYDLSTAWDISTASYLQAFSVSSEESVSESLFFKPDGTKFYIIGRGGQDVNEYTLSTAWDISTASYSQNFSVASQENLPRGLFFKYDGTKMYVIGNTGDDVNEYNLSTAWDISTASYSQNFSVSSEETVPQALFFRADGLKMYVMGSASGKVHEYDISPVATLGTGSFASSDVGKRIFVDDGGEAILINTNGTTVLNTDFGSTSYTSGNWSLSGLDADADNGITIPRTFLDSWDVSTGSYVRFFSVSSLEGSITGVVFKPDGTEMTIIGTGANTAYTFTLSTPWNISTASYTRGKALSSQDNQQQDIFFDDSGTRFYAVGSGNNDVYQYSLSTAWDVTSATYVTNYNVTNDNSLSSVFFKSDGTKMYVLGRTNDKVYEYGLTTAWDISTASLNDDFYVGGQEATPQGMFFKSDGTKLYITGTIGDDVNEYDVSPAWDVSTATYVQNFSVNQDSLPMGLYFSPDGERFYTAGDYGNAVFQYDLGNLYQPTAQYFPAVTNTGGQIDSTYWTDINSMTADDADNDGQAYYAVSTDDRTTWSVAKASDGVRDIVRNNGGTWQYNSNATYGSTTWTNATTNDEFAALAQAMTVAVNQMDKAQLDAVADGSHFTLGNTLDLGIIMYISSTGTSPTSDGVSINYDAAALNQGAVLGTDYDYDFPASDKVRITSNATQNLKIRVV